MIIFLLLYISVYGGVHAYAFIRLKRGLELGVPYEHTWSCYRSDSPACGRCDSCFYRLEAFRQVGVEDPIEYAEGQ